MTKKHLILGTAGHVDHGKTTLIQALTGFDCDTHKQEKERGITMNLGFTHLDLPDGNSLGIVDVPGHADFIKTMVAGSIGIDFVLFIIAADEGIMPQSTEHLEILNLLGIKKGIIVVTKIDTVDEELLELVEEEINDFKASTVLENSKICFVSSITKKGIKELIDEIQILIPSIPEKKSDGIFRMYIDRIFTSEGFGTVVNGSVLSGSLSLNSPLYLLPENKELRIRKLEKHGVSVENLKAGDRAAINLVGLKKSEFSRGMVLADKILEPTELIDCNLKLFDPDVYLGLWSQAIFLMGTIRKIVKIHLLDKDELSNKESGLIQVYFNSPVIAGINDSFILRNSSDTKTIGGGKIIDSNPLHHRRRRKSQINEIQRIASGKENELIASVIRKSPLPVSLPDISEKLHLSNDFITQIIKDSLPEDIIYYKSNQNYIFSTKAAVGRYKNKIFNIISKHHEKNPFDNNGKSLKELSGIFGKSKKEIYNTFLENLLEDLLEQDKLVLENNTWKLSSFKVEITNEIQDSCDYIENYLISAKHNLPVMKELIDNLSSKKMTENKINQIFKYLLQNQKIVRVSEYYIHMNIIIEAEAIILKHLKNNENGIKLSEFRDMFNTNRKMAQLLLEYFDNTKLTIRKGDVRFLKKQF